MAGDSGNQEPIRLSRETCTSLQGFSIPASAIGLPNAGAMVQTAVFVAASETGNINGDFCKVTGIVKPHNPSSPNLEFEVNLPAAWNRARVADGRRRIRRLAGDRSDRYIQIKHPPAIRLSSKATSRSAATAAIRARPGSTAASGWTMKRC